MIHTPEVAAKYISHPANKVIHILLTVFPGQRRIIFNLYRQNCNLFMYIAMEQNIKSVAVIEPCLRVMK
jgi:hypothetical protein